MLDILLTHSDDLEKEVRGDLVRYLILTLLKRLLKPVELAAKDQPSSDSTEARIMQSDLLSGGLEPHLFHLLEENELV